MSQPRVHTWTFVAQSPIGISVKLRAYKAEPPFEIDSVSYEQLDTSLPVVITDDGELVERLDQGVYSVTTTGMIVASMDPHAP